MQEDQTNNTSGSSGDNPAPQDAQPAASPVVSPKAGGSGLSGLLKNKKKLGIIGGIIVLLIAIGVAAYYLVYLPNTPQNVLKKSAANTLKLQQVSGKGSASVTSKGKQSSTVVIGYDIQSDIVKNATNAKLDVAFNGVKVPLEVRAIDKAIYLKFSDLSTVQALATGYMGPESGAFMGQLGKQITNKWIEIDESLVKNYTSDKCSLLSDNNQLSEKDINQIISLYDKNTFIDINKTAKDTVDGRKVTKAELGINKDKAKAFGKDFEQLDMVKKLNSCGGDKVTGSDSAKKADNSKTSYEFTVWLDASKKEIVKVAIKA
ncbi:MAG: hypothetical protein AAB914_04815, partial [Patescibacteria group bacterium]